MIYILQRCFLVYAKTLVDLYKNQVEQTLRGHINRIGLPQDNLPSSSENEECIVPQKRYAKGAARNNPSHRDFVVFVRTDGSYIPVASALGEDYRGLINCDEPSLCGTGHTVTVRFEWPGYPSADYQLRTYDWCHPPNRLPLSKLSTELAKIVQKFIKEAQGRTIDPKHAEWMVGPGGIHTGNLRLGALEQVSAGSWQPRLFFKRSQ